MTKEERSQLAKRVKLKSPDQYRVNPTSFIKIEVAEAAYLLGLIWADGWVSKSHGVVSVSLKEKDMEDVAKTLDAMGKWTYCGIQKREVKKRGITASTSNRILGEHLVNHGYRDKTWRSPDSILSIIPDSLRHYFFRGVFDGDGCLTINGLTSWSITSGYDQDWTYMTSLCQRLKISYRIDRTFHKERKANGESHRSSAFVVQRHADIRVIMAHIYQGRDADKIGLERKWNTWNTFRSMVFGKGNNRYSGVWLDGVTWISKITKNMGSDTAITVGRFATEEEAYQAQQDKMRELGISPHRERFYGLRYKQNIG